MDKSEGNWREIKEFIETRTPENKEAAYKLLENISDKDLRDIPADILCDHFDNTLKKYDRNDYKSDDIYYKYMLNPRIYYENIVAYRKYFQNEFADIANLKRSEIAAELLTRTKKNIRIQKEIHYSAYITPIGVYELGVSDKVSRNIFFAAVLRRLGVPARLEKITKTLQYFDLGKWINIYPDKDEQKQPATGYFLLEPEDANHTLPLYYQHFTISKLDYETGLYETLDYEWKAPLSDFAKKLKAETGRYRLVAGNRRKDGVAFVKVTYFTVEKDKTTEVPFILNPLKKRAQIR